MASLSANDRKAALEKLHVIETLVTKLCIKDNANLLTAIADLKDLLQPKNKPATDIPRMNSVPPKDAEVSFSRAIFPIDRECEDSEDWTSLVRTFGVITFGAWPIGVLSDHDRNFRTNGFDLYAKD